MEVNDLLIELGTEELPPADLLALSVAFASGLTELLSGEQLTFTKVRQFATPRRLAVIVSDLVAQQADRQTVKLGPNVKAAYDADGQPSKAATGFARGCGVEFEALTTENTDKGERLAFISTEAGQSLAQLLPGVLTRALEQLPIAKRMRWGAQRDEFIRPLRWLVLLYGEQVIDTELFGIAAGRTTRGHRFHGKAELALTAPADYEDTLRADGFVIASFDERWALIESQLDEAAANTGGKVVVDNDLLDEVTSLVEWPQALLGQFDEAFLTLPREALISVMTRHQKYFHLLDDAGNLLPNFITVANIASTAPELVIAGNERVIRPRLADAAFFYQTDSKFSLEKRRDQLKSVVFQAKLGTLYDKTERVAKLARIIATQLQLPIEDAVRAAQLCKSDLVTDMVGEFADLQGIMGRYYARNDHEPEAVAEAIAEHYQPRFARDTLPASDAGMVLALADRIDTLVGIFGIGQAPTGSKDPFALRRAALGVLRIVIEKELALDLRVCLQQSATLFAEPSESDSAQQVLDYIMERLRAWYSEQNIAVETFLAVHARGLSKPLEIDQRVQAVAEFSKREEAAALAAANKRVVNILSKVEAGQSLTAVNAKLLSDAAELALADCVSIKTAEIAPLVERHDYAAALASLAELKKPVDDFFDAVMVMVDDDAVRNNRLALLQQLRDLFLQIADISLLAKS
ncbi:MAG: glycine--tRNA ligase subunit beta [Pseudomonadales bacterium]